MSSVDVLAANLDTKMDLLIFFLMTTRSSIDLLVRLSADETATDRREVARTEETVGPEQNEAGTDEIKPGADFTGSDGTFGNSKFAEAMIGFIELADLDLVCLDS